MKINTVSDLFAHSFQRGYLTDSLIERHHEIWLDLQTSDLGYTTYYGDTRFYARCDSLQFAFCKGGLYNARAILLRDRTLEVTLYYPIRADSDTIEELSEAEISRPDLYYRLFFVTPT